MTLLTYPSPVDQLLTLGEPHTATDHQDYTVLGIGPEHVPDLIRLATDDDLRWGEEAEEPATWGPIHAWYALGQLRAESAVEPLLTTLHHIDADDDEWALEEMPEVFAQIGPAAMPALAAFVADSQNRLDSAGTAGHGLQRIAERFPEKRAECVAALTARLERFAENDEVLNALLISDLVELRAIEALPLIERAFAAGPVDEMVRGDWEDIQIELGLKTQREHPRKPNLLDRLMPPDLRPKLAEPPRPVSDDVRQWNDQVEAKKQAKILAQAEKAARLEEKRHRRKRKKYTATENHSRSRIVKGIASRGVFR
jgi:hypothetical protein